NEKGYKSTVIAKGNDTQLSCTSDSTCNITSATIQAWSNKRISSQRKWIRIDASIKGTNNVFGGRIQSTLQIGDSTKVSSIRLARPLAEKDEFNEYAFYMEIPRYHKPIDVSLTVVPNPNKVIQLQSYQITLLTK
ncbi:MAG: hypothetical protein HKP14_10255, partial [Bacteroidia bacterium]|nr:hypothetical protein [Bacteroidia bacterium]